MNDFKNIGYKDFAKFASDETMSDNEKIGFPDSYRESFDEAILADIVTKLPNIEEKCTFLDIGPGCSNLSRKLLKKLLTNNSDINLIDSKEMLDLIDNNNKITKMPGFYPNDFLATKKLEKKFDAILCYSVLHYIIKESSLWDFIDLSISFLKEGGQFLIGDIPNLSKRKRFFSSEKGKAFHKNFMKTNENPKVDWNESPIGEIDDSVICSIISRSRAQGCEAYIVPQRYDLPMQNRREDVIIIKP